MYLLVVSVLYNMRRLLTHSCLKLTCDPSRILQGPFPFQYVQNIQHFIARHSTQVQSNHPTILTMFRLVAHDPSPASNTLDDVTNTLLLVNVTFTEKFRLVNKQFSPV